MSKWQRPPAKAPGRITGGVRVTCTGETVVDGVRLERQYAVERIPSKAERAAAKAARRAANRAAWRLTHRPQAKGKTHVEVSRSQAFLDALDELRDAKRDVEQLRAHWNGRVREQRAVVAGLTGRKARRALVELDELLEERREAMREANAAWRRAKVRLRHERDLDRQAMHAAHEVTRQWRDERFGGRVEWVTPGDEPGPGE